MQAVEKITRISESGESPTKSEASLRVSEKSEQDEDGLDLSRNSISVKGDSARTLSAHAGGKSGSACDVRGADLGEMPSLSHLT